MTSKRKNKNNNLFQHEKEEFDETELIKLNKVLRSKVDEMRKHLFKRSSTSIIKNLVQTDLLKSLEDATLLKQTALLDLKKAESKLFEIFKSSDIDNHIIKLQKGEDIGRKTQSFTRNSSCQEIFFSSDINSKMFSDMHVLQRSTVDQSQQQLNHHRDSLLSQIPEYKAEVKPWIKYRDLHGHYLRSSFNVNHYWNRGSESRLVDKIRKYANFSIDNSYKKKALSQRSPSLFLAPIFGEISKSNSKEFQIETNNEVLSELNSRLDRSANLNKREPIMRNRRIFERLGKGLTQPSKKFKTSLKKNEFSNKNKSVKDQKACSFQDYPDYRTSKKIINQRSICLNQKRIPVNRKSTGDDSKKRINEQFENCKIAFTDIKVKSEVVTDTHNSLVNGLLTNMMNQSLDKSQPATASTIKQGSEEIIIEDLEAFASNLDVESIHMTNLFDLEFELEY
jgi:hypothetical protein